MFTQIFGDFLLRSSMTTVEEMKNALLQFLRARQSVGEIAIDSCYMSYEQAIEIQNMQMSVDLPFGELAVDLCYLTFKQLDDILERQMQGHVLLSRILFKDEEIRKAVLEKFFKEIGIKPEEALKCSDTEKCSVIAEWFKLKEMSDAVWSYILLLLKNLTRFFGGDFVLLKPETKELNCEWHAEQEVSGEVCVKIMFDMPESMLKVFAARFMNEPCYEVDEIAQAAIADFLNLQNGMFAVTMSNEHNVELDVTPPIVSLHNKSYDIPTLIELPIMYNFGEAIIRIQVS